MFLIVGFPVVDFLDVGEGLVKCGVKCPAVTEKVEYKNKYVNNITKQTINDILTIKKTSILNLKK